MNRDEFLSELEYLIQDVPEEDRTEAVQYYRDYFDEAGFENEEAVISEFGSPERVAAIIRSDLAGHLTGGGEFTERGYGDERFKDPNYQMAKRYDLPEPKEQFAEGSTVNSETKPRTSKILIVVLWVVLFLTAAPVLLSVGGGILGILAGCLGALLALLVAAGAVTAALLIAGIALIILGIITIFTNPLGGLLILGAAAFFFGVGMLAMVISVLIYGKLLPFFANRVLYLFNKIVNGRRKKQV